MDSAAPDSEYLREARKGLSGLDGPRRELARIIAHEVRGPLSVIAGMTRTIVDNWDRLSDDKLQSCLATLERQAEVMLTLSGDLLRLEQADDHLELEPKSIDLSSAFRDAIADLPSERDIEVAVTIEDKATVFVDPVRFDQIIRNLLANAIRYAVQKVSVRAEILGEDVILSVADDGPGVSSSLVPRLFDPFTRGPVHDQWEGFGVGLAIVRSLVDAMDGSVWYEPALPKGACFKLRLPASSTSVPVSDL